MGAPLPAPPTGHTRAHYGLPVPASLVPVRTLDRALTGRCVAGPTVDDAVRTAAGLLPDGVRVALEHVPGAGRDAAEFTELIAAVHAAGIAVACELTLPVDRLGPADARHLLGAATADGLGVALTGSSGSVLALADAVPEARIVVPAGRPDAEAVCRASADGRVRLTAGRGAAADLAFVRCLNVLMAGGGHHAVAAGDPRLVAITGERAAWNDRSPDSWEYVMSYGIRTAQLRRLVAAGCTVRVAVPSGPGAAAGLVRRLAVRS
jgi:proline dehydrogenase